MPISFKSNFIKVTGRWRGHLFDGCFASVAMDEGHLLAAIRDGPPQE
jgi:hypothetical protein